MSLISRKITVALRIEGIGDASSTQSTLYAYRGSRPLVTQLGASTGRYWVHDALVTLPQTVERSVDPWSSRYDTSPMSLELDLAAVGDVIPVQAWEPAANLTSAATDSATAIRLNSSALASLIVYIGDETVSLGSYTDLGGGVYEYAVTRAYHDSRAQGHPEGEPVFLAPPAWRGRRVELVMLRADSTGAPQITTIWSGYLDDVRTAELGTRVVLECREVLDALVDRQVNAGAPDLAATGLINVDLYGLYFLSGIIPFESRVYKQWTAQRWIPVQAGGALYVVDQYRPGELDLAFATPYAGDLGEDGKVFEESNLGRSQPLTKSVYELFVVSKELDALYTDLSATSPLGDLRYHPLAIAFALLTSTPRTDEFFDPLEYDVLGGAWGCPVWLWLDVEGWTDLIAATPEIQIDQLFLGWDGEAVNVIDVIVDKLLRPYGFFLAITEHGMLGVARLISPTVVDQCAASDRQLPVIRPSSGGQFEWSYSAGTAVGEVTANVGALPWASEASTVTVRLYGRAQRSVQFADSRIYTYDLSTRSRALVSSYADGDGGDALTLELIDRAIRASWALPRIQITTIDSREVASGLRYDLGAYVTLNGASLPPAPVFRLPDGTRVDPADPDYEVYFLGQIMAARLNLATLTWDLDLLLVAWRTGTVVRYIAPSARVESYDGGLFELEIHADSDYGGSGTDAAGFAVGDEVVFVERDGTDSGEAVRTITIANDRYLTLDADTANNPSGLILRLADSDVYANTGATPGADCVDRPWVYLADTSDEIDRPSAQVEPADLYG